MYIEKSMNGECGLDIAVKIYQHEPGLYTVYINGGEPRSP